MYIYLESRKGKEKKKWVAEWRGVGGWVGGWMDRRGHTYFVGVCLRRAVLRAWVLLVVRRAGMAGGWKGVRERLPYWRKR